MLTTRQRGITLIEVMVAMTIIVIILVFGIPSFTGFIASAKIRTAAEGYLNGIAQARAEAVRLNTPVEFMIDTEGWKVRRVSDQSVLHQGAGKEGQSEATATPTPNDSTRITYDQLGRVLAASPIDASAPFTQVDFDVPNGSSLGSLRRVLRVQVQTGGIAKLCDPSVGTSDTRACT